LQSVQFRVHNRFNEFLQNIKNADFFSFRFVLNALGWWISFFLVISAFENDYTLKFIWLIVHGYFWYSFNKDLVKKILPPIELLLVAILFFAILDFTLLNTAGTNQNSQYVDIFGGWTFRGIVHKFFLSLLVLFLGLLLIANSKQKQFVLVVYILFGIVGHYAFFYDQYSYLFIFQFFLFFSLLKRTTWLETLTRLELIIYFALLLWFFLTITEPDFFKIIRESAEQNQTITFSLPYFLYLSLKLYWLALLIRIPIVVIYNHAGLSRKLWIAGLFQSSFPQFIQLGALLLIFFLFISGWQANQLRDRLTDAINQNNKMVNISDNFDNQNPGIFIQGYRPTELSESSPDLGVIALTSKTIESTKSNIDYFFYQKEKLNNQTKLKVAKINKNFLDRAAEDLNVLAGSGLVAYSYAPKRWMRVLYEDEYWQKDENIKINPFGLIFPFAREIGEENDKIKNVFKNERTILTKSNNNLIIVGVRNPLLIMGRIYVPLINSAETEKSGFVIDIYYDLRSLFQWNFMTQIILALIILYSLFNLLVIRRVISFGAQINDSVVKKFDELKKGIREVSSGNLDYKVELEGEDEFVELADRFNQMGIRLQETIEEAREKDRLDQELKIARQVQISLLPEKLPDIPGYNIVADLKTATEIGGDFYDLVPLDNSRYLFSVGDVSGKGSSAAFYMAQFISLLRYTPKFTEQPQEIALRLNEYIMKQITDRKIFITAIIGILNIKTNEVVLIRAGHNLPILISDHEKAILKEINSPGMGIGLTKSNQIFKKALKPYKFKLKENDKLIIYTDGIVEARCPVLETNQEDDYEVYGEERFSDLLIKNKSKNALELLNILTDDLNNFYGPHPRIDDHTVLILEKIPVSTNEDV